MQDLFRKYLDNQCSPAELKELLQHFDVQENESLLRALIIESFDNNDIVGTDEENRWTGVTEETYAAIKKQLGLENPKIVPLFRKTWFRIAAAAVLLIGAFAIYKLTGNAGSDKQEIVKINDQKQDIAPGGNKAVLTLGDGSTIILDSAANGHLASQGNTKVIKLDGQLAYTASGDAKEVVYNSISTPRGGQYQLVLADGTKVWLNAASSLRYPATFSGNERKVELTGEGYFEVAKNAAMPFKVNVAGKGEVEVLGTHFNINSYADESTINTTLLEGSVKVTGLTTHDSRLIIPGQQAELNNSGQITVNKNVNTDEVIAWKEGKFHFESSDMKTILRQFSRWYDIEVIYEKPVGDEPYFCIIDRNSSLSNVLKSLQANSIQFKIENKRLFIR